MYSAAFFCVRRACTAVLFIGLGFQNKNFNFTFLKNCLNFGKTFSVFGIIFAKALDKRRYVVYNSAITQFL